MSAGDRRRGYTLVEVLVAIAIFMVLIVPLAWLGIQTASGRARAARLDDAIALAREDWGLVRRTDPGTIGDTSYERKLGDRVLRLVRTVDTAAAADPDSTTSGLAPAPKARPRTDVRTCVVSPESVAGADSVRCFVWRVARVPVQP